MAYQPGSNPLTGGSAGPRRAFNNPLTNRGYDPSYFQPKAPPPQAAPQQPVQKTGASFWGRMAQVGVGMKNKADIALHGAEHVVQSGVKATAHNIEKKGVASGIGQTAGNVFDIAGGKALRSQVAQNVKGLAGPTASQKTQVPFAPKSNVPDIMKAQASAQAAQKAGRVSPEAIKALGQIQNAGDKVSAYKLVSNPKLSNKDVMAQLIPIIKKQSDTTKQAIGTALVAASYAIGGPETKAMLKGIVPFLKGAAINTAVGTAGGVGTTLVEKPGATKKELAKSGAVGGAIGAGTSVASSGAGKLINVTKTALGKDKEVTNVIEKAKTNALIQKGKQANIGTVAIKSPPTKVPVKDLGETKLLAAGERQPVKGTGFTMSPTANQTAISRGQEITRLEDRLTRFQQGKLSITPEQAKADAAQLAGLKSGKIAPKTAAEKLTGGYKMPPLTTKTPAMAAEAAIPKGEVASLTGKAPSSVTPTERTFKDIKTSSAKSDTKGFFRAIHEWFNPVPGKQGAQVQRDLRTSVGGLTQNKIQSEALARNTTKEFGKMSPEEHLKFIQNVDTGTKHATPQLEKLGATLKEFNKGNEQIAKSLNPDLQTIEHYTTHSGILDTGQSKAFVNRWAKAPFKGSPGALKERNFPTVAEMVQWANDKGIPVKETNPMTLAINSRAGLLKAKMAQDFIEKQTAKGVDPEIVQKVIDRYMEPGLAHSQVYKTIRQAGNSINNLQLGLSGFHFTGTALNATFSEFSNGINNLLTGHPLKAAGNVVRGAYAPVDYAIGGHKLIKDVVSGADNHYTQAARIANFNPVRNNDYIANGLKKTLQDFKTKNALGIAGTPLTIVPRTISSLAKPLMEHWVPDLKAGAFKRAIETADAKLGPKATIEARQAAYQKVADSIDNRFGQLNKDNIFWNKTLKDINNMTMRSPGWNIGTAREIGGGIKDIPGSLVSLAKGKGISERTAYTASLGAGTMLIGATLMKMFTGKGPTEMIDYFYPKTGKIDKNGNEERVSLPTYSKDIFSFLHSPGSTLSNKANPLIAITKQAVTNKDYFGNQIRNPSDSLKTQAKQEGGFLGKNLLPFSVSNTTQRVEKTAGTKAQTAFGLNPAPGYITKSPLAQDIQKTLTQEKGTTSLTPEQQAINKLKAAAGADLTSGKKDSANLQQLKSQLSPTAYKNFVKTGGDTQIQREFDKLSTESKLKMVEKYSPEQLKQLDLTVVAKSLASGSAKNVIEGLQAKGFTVDRIKQDLQKSGIDSSQMQKIKEAAKIQARINARQSRRQPKFVNPFLK